MRKPDFCICENKDADQLRGNREADQRLCFRYIDSTIPLLPKYEISSLKLSSVAVQPGLCRTWSETPKTGFLTTRLICPFMAKIEQITSWKTKEQFKIKGRFNCKTKNVIYVISCKKCGLQYVGQSGNTFNEQLRGHFMDIKQKNDVKPVSRHFILNDHTPNNVTATIVTQTTNDVNVRLRTEEVWIGKLQTKFPTGLNLIQ